MVFRFGLPFIYVANPVLRYSMVSYTKFTFLLRPHSKGFSEGAFTGVFKQPVFGACNPFTGSLLTILTTTVLFKYGAPGTAAGGLSSVSVNNVPVLESGLHQSRERMGTGEVEFAGSTNAKGGLSR
jgi:hypothetical protein